MTRQSKKTNKIKRNKKYKKKLKLRKYVFLFLCIIFLSFCTYKVYGLFSKKPETTPNVILKHKEKTYTVTSVGNMMTHDAQIAGAKTKDGNYNFDKSFEYVKSYIKDSNLSIGVFEGNVNGGKPEGYPTFNSPEGFLKSLKSVGFNVINYASNHVIDGGTRGVKSTMSKSTGNGLLNLGVKEKTSDKNYLIYNIDGHKVGLFSYTYRTGPNSINTIPIPKDVNPLINSFSYDDLNSLYKSIDSSINDMKKNGVEFIIGSFHWGDEYSTKVNPIQRKIAKKMNELGVDIILGSHPHVIEPYEIIKNNSGHSTFVIYSQGNFLSNQCYEEVHNYLTEDGLLLKFSLGLKNNKLYLKDYTIIPTWVYREPKGNKLFTHRIIPVEEVINDKNKFNLSETAYNRALNSLKSTKSILGENSLGTKSFP